LKNKTGLAAQSIIDIDLLAADVDYNNIGTYSFTNLRFAYQGELDFGDWSLSLAVNNAFEKSPPTIPWAFWRIGSQTNSGLGYDEFGRRYQLILNMNF